MEIIGESEIWSFFNSGAKSKPASNDAVRRGAGHEVASYLELATKVAELQFQNRDFVLLFRGQKSDYRDSKNQTTLKPSLFRPQPGQSTPPRVSMLNSRFERLKRAEDVLLNAWRTRPGRDRLEKYRILRWTILQHYEVCLTPLLDFTHSLRIAASFASIGAENRAYLFVVGVPNLSGAVTASAEAGLQIVRLSSVCPPEAVRPHIQEGYLLGEYPDMPDFAQKRYYGQEEIDFGRRLVAKFSFNPSSFWQGEAFPAVTPAALYPSPDQDPIALMADKVKTELGS